MRYLSVISICAVIFSSDFAARAANDSPQTFTLDGQLYAADHTSPLLDAAAKIKVQILDPSKNCILYEEEQPVDTTVSAGHFSIQVGSVVGSIKRKTLDAGNTMQKVYQNSSVIPANGVSCSGTYSPVMGAIRYVRVIVTPTSGSPNTLSPDMVMDAVPNAMVAQSVQGLERENILQSNPAVSLTQTKLEQFFLSLTSTAGGSVKFDGSNFVSYDPSNGVNLIANSVADSAISSIGWAKITSVPTSLSTIAGLSCADGKILKMVSGAWACASESGVGVESDPTVAAFAKNAPGAGLAVSGGAIVADFGTGAGKVVQGNDSRLSDSRAPNGSAGGDLSGSYPSPTVAKIQGRGVSVTAPADGQVLRYDNSSSTWNPVNFGIDDLKTSLGTSQFVSASCLASQTLIWSAVTDTFSCTDIALSGSQVSGDIPGDAANVTGTVAIAHGGTGATTAAAALNALLPSQSGQGSKILQTDGTNASWVTNSVTETDPKIGANTANYLSKWNGSALVASGLIESSGNFGIGTASPNSLLHMIASDANVTAPYSWLNFNNAAKSTSSANTGMVTSLTSTAAGQFAGAYENLSYSPSSAASSVVMGRQQIVQIPAASANNVSSLSGYNNQVTNLGSGTVGSLFASSVAAYHGGTGAATAVTGLAAAAGVSNPNSQTSTTVTANGATIAVNNLSPNATITNAYGINLSSSNSGTMTNAYGLYITGMTAGTHTNTPYDIYAADTGAYNYFGGNVGVGTASPVGKFSVQADSATYPGTISVEKPASTAPLSGASVGSGLVFTNYAGSAKVGGIYVSNGGSFTLENNSGVSLSFASPYITSTQFSISNGGSPAAPALRLDATSGSEAGLYLPAASSIGFVTARTEQMRINASGNVGIGTATPAAKLEVNGGIKPGNATTGAACAGNPEGTFAYDQIAHAPVYCNSSGVWIAIGGGASVSKVLNITGSVNFSSPTSFNVSTTIANTLLGSNPTTSLITVPLAGTYDVTVSAVTCTGGASNWTNGQIMVNGALMANGMNTATGGCGSAMARGVYVLAAGDTINGQCNNNSGYNVACGLIIVKLP